MAKLIIRGSADYSGRLLFNIDTIGFTQRAEAIFLFNQFGSNRIADDVRIEGSDGVNRIVVNSGIDGFDASDWTFDSWQAQDRVVINGSIWREDLTGSDCNDRIFGNEGADTIMGRAGADVISGGGGADTLNGGAGKDTLSYEGAMFGVKVNLGQNEASRGEAQGDSIFSFENVTGGFGADELTGSSGDNRLTGGGAADLLKGAGGADRFIYRETGDSTPDASDVIVDFSANDVIDLSATDAREGGRNNAFRFIGSDAFERAGDLRVVETLRSTIVEADTNGDGVADLQIVLQGRMDLNAGDFIL